MTPARARPTFGDRFRVPRAEGWPEGVYEMLRRAGLPVAPPVPRLPTWDPFAGVDAGGEYLFLQAELDPAHVARAATLGVQLAPV